MDEFVAFLGCFGVLFALSGPVAFIIAIVCLNKVNQLERHIRSEKSHFPDTLPATAEKPVSSYAPPVEPAITPEPAAAQPIVPVPTPAVESPAMAGQELRPQEPEPTIPEVKDMSAMLHQYSKMLSGMKKYPEDEVSLPKAQPTVSLEQVIGTRGILIAGVITVIIGVGLFLKYAIDKNWLTPWVQIGMATAGGLIAIIIGEITRRRGYEIVAKGTSAMGFAILYIAVFSAFRGYHLIDTVPAFAWAIVITLVAMVYAVALDEVLIAFLSLLGGYLTPVIIQTGQNLPHHLFGYVLILSCGAIVCAFWRRWRAVNFAAFFGTFLLYILWFEKFVRDALPYVQSQENVVRVAECWLGVFFVVYLILPLLYGFAKKVPSHKEDIILPGFAGAITFYYLWTMLEEFFRTELAICAAVMGVCYLITALVSWNRCREDKDLQAILSVAGIAFITTALPLYFEANALVVGWTVEAVVLIGAGVIYTSTFSQVLGFIVTALSIGGLYRVGLHEGDFLPVLNAVFGIWVFAAAGIFVSHLFYRWKKETEGYRTLSEVLFLAAGVVLIAACCLEWHSWCEMKYTGQDWDTIFIKGLLCIFTVFSILFTAVGLFYASALIRSAGILAVTAGIFGLLGAFSHIGFYKPVLNTVFGTWMAVGAGAGVCHLLYRYWKEPRPADYDVWTQLLFIAAGAVILGGCCLEWHRFWSHQELAREALDSLTLRGVLCSLSVFIIVLVLRPFSPGGAFSRAAAAIACGLVGLFAVFLVNELYYREFRFLINGIFVAQAATAAAVFIAAVLLRQEKQTYAISPMWYQGFAIFGVVLLWILLSEQAYLYWSCLNEFGSGLVDWEFRANMSLSLLWAGYGAVLLIVGFWKHLAVIRYMALALFGLLLAKIFIVDKKHLSHYGLSGDWTDAGWGFVSVSISEKAGVL